MKALVLLLLASSFALAQPQKSKIKAAPDKFTKAAGDAFKAANAADAAGDLRTALGLYQKAHAISPHPSTMYNIADVQRRLQLLRDAIKSYETYLVMSPEAKDRAEVETTIEQISKTPGTLVITTLDQSNKEAVDLPAAFVLVDGKIEKRPGPVPSIKERQDKPGIRLQVPPGDHIVDLVTPITYAWQQRCDVGPGETRFCELRAAPRIDGNIVVSAHDRTIDVLAEKRGRDMVYQRVELPAGKHRLIVKDRSYYCAPLPVETTGGNAVAYVFISTSEFDELKRCRTLDIKQHRLQFEP
jgi:tetratricopeptide (TPR) repeat protein